MAVWTINVSPKVSEGEDIKWLADGYCLMFTKEGGSFGPGFKSLGGV